MESKTKQKKGLKTHTSKLILWISKLVKPKEISKWSRRHPEISPSTYIQIHWGEKNPPLLFRRETEKIASILHSQLTSMHHPDFPLNIPSDQSAQYKLLYIRSVYGYSQFTGRYNSYWSHPSPSHHWLSHQEWGPSGCWKLIHSASFLPAAIASLCQRVWQSITMTF